MDNILKALGVDKDCKIAVLQYERDVFGVGKEEELHWAIWVLYDQDVSLFTTRKCLGGVYIGSIKHSQLKLLREVVYTNPPTNRPAEWNCRDWVMEVIQLFSEKGWLYANIPAQSTLLPSLRRASVATTSAYAESRTALPVIVELEDVNGESTQI
ncbi:hypothetical protein POSPLADRAFT_1057065 [Postia placenta MAD-698-R-SB12]|uniref:Uncharacterized protein n=1 Tax=Postia placenta MAD-698-R-SB12 TaxID=670580 RepID=A0A1X6N1V3_9APHY|nr:hypothetical protein POSPLADRAFT_1057065 [Postia placenta MAD-698-R-SB12]OSX62452.1 hypothetical protein POSPLADRAFT_1057065 [Postia placenta MAD-698-R-SB12]